MTNIQFAVIVTALIGCGVWVIFSIKNKTRWRIAVAPLTYFIHILVFNMFAEMGHISPGEMNSWSNAVRLHSEFLFLFLAVILMNKETSKWI